MPFAGAGSPPGKRDLIKEVRCVLSLARGNFPPVCRRSILDEVRMVLLLLAASGPGAPPSQCLGRRAPALAQGATLFKIII